MPLTVAGVESEILARVGGKAAQAGLSSAADGTNPDLRSPIRKALRYVGRAPADPLTPADSDLAAVPAANVETLLDAAVLETLYAVQGRFADGFDQKAQEEQQWLHQIMTDTAAMIEEYKSRVPRAYFGKLAVGQSVQGTTIPGDAFRPCNPLNPRTWPYPS